MKTMFSKLLWRPQGQQAGIRLRLTRGLEPKKLEKKPSLIFKRRSCEGDVHEAPVAAKGGF